MSENQIAKTVKPKTLRDHLESPEFQGQIAKVMPRHMKPERMARVAITAMTRNPMLAECTPESFFKCMLDLSALGLEPDGRRAHLIPFKNNSEGTVVCTLIVDYKGLAELAYNSGVVSYLHADVVRDGDIFDFSKGELRNHVPWFLRRDADKPEESGPVFAAYALARLKDGSEKVEVMSLDEINSIRNASQGYKMAVKYGKPTSWTTNETEMQKKTAFRRLTKWLPLSPEIRDRLDAEDEDEERFSSAKPAKVQVLEPKFIAPGGIGSASAPQIVPEPEPVQAAAPETTEAPRVTRRMVREDKPAPEPAAEDSKSALWSMLQMKCCADLGDLNSWLVTSGHSKAEFASWEDVPSAIVEKLTANDGFLIKQFIKKFGTK